MATNLSQHLVEKNISLIFKVQKVGKPRKKAIFLENLRYFYDILDCI
jgi:hypothetical protein